MHAYTMQQYFMHSTSFSFQQLKHGKRIVPLSLAIPATTFEVKTFEMLFAALADVKCLCYDTPNMVIRAALRNFLVFLNPAGGPSQITS